MTIETIYNYQYLTNKLATSGQPTEEELVCIAHSGYDIVINLGLADTDYAVKNEALFFAEQGINYIHIPVLFDQPEHNDFIQFTEIMERYKKQKIFIHCAANKRVSVFIALYRIKKLGWLEEKALIELHQIWEPNKVWQSFMKLISL